MAGRPLEPDEDASMSDRTVHLTGKSRTAAGFSFVETMIVLGILALAVSIIVPSLVYWQRSRELQDAAQSLRRALESAHMQALGQGHVYGVGFHVGTSDPDGFMVLGLYELDDPADNVYAKTHFLPGTVRYQLPVPASGLPALSNDVRETTLSGLIAFRPSGEVEPRYLAGGASSNPSLMLKHTGGKTRTVTVDRFSGKVSVS